jgi:hypothetical protein
MMLGQLFFQNIARGAGWSEGHFIDETDYTVALAKLRDIGTDRKALFTDNTKISFLKVSDVDVTRDAFVDGDQTHVGLGQGTYAPVLATQDNFPDVALLLRYTTANGKWGLHYLRSIPENQVNNGVYVPSADWLVGFTAYVANIQLNTRQRVKAGPPPLYDYLSIEEIAAERVTRRKAGRFFGLLVGRGRRP